MKMFLFFAVLAVAACRESGHEFQFTPKPPAPTTLSLTEFQKPTFGELDWQDKCTGTKQFFSDFQKRYLPDVELSFDEYSCKSETNIDSIYFNHIQPIFKKGEKT